MTMLKDISGTFVGIKETRFGFAVFSVEIKDGKVVDIIHEEEPNLKPIAVERAKLEFIRHIAFKEFTGERNK